MKRFVHLWAAVAAFSATVLFGLSSLHAQGRMFRPLFNGKDFGGWEARPNKSTVVEGIKKDEKGNYIDALGVNKDPTKVFAVVIEDGKPAVRCNMDTLWQIHTHQKSSCYARRMRLSTLATLRPPLP